MFDIGRDNEVVRNKWLENVLSSLEPGLKILDAGAGELKNAKFCAHLKYVSQDFGEYNGDGDSKGFQMGTWNSKKVDILSDICEIPLPDSSFDVILCSEVLEHLPNPVAALLELDRLLKSGGIIILTAPFRSMTHFSPYHFCDGFNKYFYQHHLKNYSFIETKANGTWYDCFAEQLRLLPRVSKRYSNFWLSIALYLYAMPLYWMLPILRYFDKGSDEVSTYGYFIRAKKN